MSMNKLSAVVVADNEDAYVVKRDATVLVTSYRQLREVLSNDGPAALIVTRDAIKKHNAIMFGSLTALRVTHELGVVSYITSESMSHDLACRMATAVLSRTQPPGWQLKSVESDYLLESFRDYDTAAINGGQYPCEFYTEYKRAMWYPSVLYLLRCGASVHGLSALIRWVGHPTLYVARGERFDDARKMMMRRLKRRMSKYSRHVGELALSRPAVQSEVIAKSVFSDRELFAKHLYTSAFGDKVADAAVDSRVPNNQIAQIMRAAKTPQEGVKNTVQFTIELLASSWLANVTHVELFDKRIFSNENSYSAFKTIQDAWVADNDYGCQRLSDD